MEKINDECLKDMLTEFERPVAEVLYHLQPYVFPNVYNKIPPKNLDFKKAFFARNPECISYWDQNLMYMESNKQVGTINIKKGLVRFLIEDAIKDNSSEIIFDYSRCIVRNGSPAYTNGHESSNSYVDVYYEGLIKINLKLVDEVPRISSVLLGTIENRERFF